MSQSNTLKTRSRPYVLDLEAAENHLKMADNPVKEENMSYWAKPSPQAYVYGRTQGTASIN